MSVFVASARKRKDNRERYGCYTCHEPIEIGQAYFWHKDNRWAMRYNWHQGCKAPRPSVLESNEKRSATLAAFEDAWDRFAELDSETLTRDDCDPIIEDLKDALDGVRDLYQESATQIEDGFGHPTSSSEEQQEHADEVENVADSLEDEADFDSDDTPEELYSKLQSAIENAEGGMP